MVGFIIPIFLIPYGKQKSVIILNKSKMLKELKKELNYTLTENGAVSNVSTFNKCLDFFGLAGAMRDRPDDALSLFQDAFYEDKLVAVRLMFYFRDIRGGQGERQLFRNCLNWLSTNTEVNIPALFPFIVEHGRWDDMYCLVDTPYETQLFEYIREQLEKDLSSEYPSLLAKWLKSENTSSRESVKLATKTRKALRLSSKDYRKILSKLRAKINVVETLMSSGNWERIDYSVIPSAAALRYRLAFMKHEPLLYTDYINSLKNKTEVAKSTTLYPYELVKKCNESGISSEDRVYLDSAWENLPNYLNSDNSRSIAVIDVSYSMFGIPITASISLGMYMAERNKGYFQNHFITFETYPKLIEINPALDFVDRVKKVYSASWGGSTDVKAVFDLLLNTAVKNNLPQEEMPENLYIVSDMEFNRACPNLGDTLFNGIEKQWNYLGYQLPRIIFWNVNARQNQFPKIDGKVTLVSGFSPSIFQSTIKNLSALETMKDAINKYTNIFI